jgi:hypothetical protein
MPICSRLKNGNILSGVITQINVLATIIQASSTWVLDKLSMNVLHFPVYIKKQNWASTAVNKCVRYSKVPYARDLRETFEPLK